MLPLSISALRTALPLEADGAVDDVFVGVALAVAAARPPLPLLLAGALRCHGLRSAAVVVRGIRLPLGRLEDAGGVDAMGLRSGFRTSPYFRVLSLFKCLRLIQVVA